MRKERSEEVAGNSGLLRDRKTQEKSCVPGEIERNRVREEELGGKRRRERSRGIFGYSSVEPDDEVSPKDLKAFRNGTNLRRKGKIEERQEKIEIEKEKECKVKEVFVLAVESFRIRSGNVVVWPMGLEKRPGQC